MEHNWDLYFDTGSEYWKKIQKIYEENDYYPKVIVSGRNLHHKFMRSFSRLEGTEIDNDKDNLVSLSLGDHFLVHYYLWKCTKKGYKRRTSVPVHFMFKKSMKFLTDETIEQIAKDWKNLDITLSEETKRKISEANKGKPFSEEHKRKLAEAKKGKHRSEEVKQKIANSRKGVSSGRKGQTWSDETRQKMAKRKGKHYYNNGIKQVFVVDCPEGFVPGRLL